MKKIVLLLQLFFTLVCSAQIELEHTYTESAVTRVKLEYSGEKYYTFKKATNELIFYNADHSLWKTIALPIALSTYNRTTVTHVSEAVLNLDTNLEIAFSYNDVISDSYLSKIISEDGTVLFEANAS